MPHRHSVLWTPVAKKDLVSIIDFISKESPQAALKVLHFVRSKAASLYRSPKRGRKIPELLHIPGLSFRELILSPWRLIYRLKQNRVEVLAFFDGRRDLAEVLFERLSRID